MRTAKTIFLLFMMTVPTLFYGQRQVQQTLSSDRGLSSTLIGDILQDKSGNLWIATENGLNKYNGVKLKNYFHDKNDQHSLASNYVRTLFEDKDGQLYIGTYAGVQLYDPATDSFSLPATYPDGSVFYNLINHFIQRKNGDVLVSGNVLCRIVIREGNPIAELLDLPIPTNSVEEVMEDREGRLWITQEGNGVFRLDEDNSVHRYLDRTGIDPFVLRLMEDKKGNILAGTSNDGVYLYDKQLDKILPVNDEKYIVRSVLVNNDAETLLCTDGKGLKVFDNRTGEISDYPIELNIVEARKAKVHAATKDNLGNLWLALYQQGATMIPKEKSPFHYIGSHSPICNIIGRCCVTAIRLGTNGDIYVGTDNDGLYIVSPDKKTSTHISPDKYPNIPPILIGILEDSENYLWMGSYGSGVARLNLKTMKCEKIKGVNETLNEKEPVNNVYDFVEDKEKRVWIATMGGGLQYFDLKTKKVTICKDINALVNNWISCIKYSKQTNSLLLGTYEGLWRIGLSDFGKDCEHILSRSIVHNIFEDSDGIIWAATSDGLARWEGNADGLGHQDIKVFSVEDGFPSNICYSIEEDSQNQLWVSTGLGLVRMNRGSLNFTCFYVEDGIQGNEFSKNASVYNPQTKEVFFGGVNGITWFQSKDILSNSHKWKVHISEMYLAGNPIIVGTKSGNKNIIDVPVYEANDFYLSHNDNSFTLEIGTNDLGDSKKKVIYYSMDDDPWIALPKETESISFSNLPTGTYAFKAKVIDGSLESDIRTVFIHIRPAWWQTWWTLLAVLVIISIIVYYILQQYRHRRILRLKMYHHIQTERNTESKLQFLTNVSHKIRTPMTLIINPLQKLIENDKDTERQESYMLMHRNAERIMTLVNQFMDVKKLDKRNLKAEIEEWHNEASETNTTGESSDYTIKHEEDRPTLLIAEDDREIRNYLISELSDTYNVVPCEDGAVALDNILKNTPNIIVSDVMMPKMDGFTLVKKIRQNINLNDVPIILLTARSLNEDNIKGLELGADAYITKPFDIRLLKQNIASLLKSRQTLKNIYSGSQAQEGKVSELKAQTPDEILIEKVMRCINENIGNPELSVEMIAGEVGMTRVHLHRKLRQLTNQTTRDLIRNQRITIAAKLLREKKMPISEVAYHVGFSSPAHFTTTFKAMFGMSPSQYTNQNSK